MREQPAPPELEAIGAKLRELAAVVLRHVHERAPAGWTLAAYVVSSANGAYLPSLSLKKADGSIEPFIDAPAAAEPIVAELFRRSAALQDRFTGFSLAIKPEGSVETRFTYDGADATRPPVRLPDPADVVAGRVVLSPDTVRGPSAVNTIIVVFVAMAFLMFVGTVAVFVVVWSNLSKGHPPAPASRPAPPPPPPRPGPTKPKRH